MPRQPRVKSLTGIYHIMMRGINKEQIFKRDAHKRKFKEEISIIHEDMELSIIAYCIMDNHVHLLLKTSDDNLEILMKRLNIKYAIYYNKLENRYGHVFQDRFKSEAVENEKYFFGVLRYIHNNPIKAGIVMDISDYPWSSATDYLNNNSNIIDNKYLHEIKGLFKNKNEFIKFHNIIDNNLYIDTKEEEAKSVYDISNRTIEDFMLQYKITDQSQISIEQRENLAERLLMLKILTERQIAELCNLSFYKVFTICKRLKESNVI